VQPGIVRYVIIAGAGVALLSAGLFLLNSFVNSFQNAPSYIQIVIIPIATGIATYLFMQYKNLLNKEVGAK